jgi:hypothetical protein
MPNSEVMLCTSRKHIVDWIADLIQEWNSLPPLCALALFAFFAIKKNSSKTFERKIYSDLALRLVF